MPIYIYQNPETDEVKEVLQGMNDPHEYEENGVKWTRVFIAPNHAVDTKVDPFSEQSFMKGTASKKGTIGDVMDFSEEQSQIRKEKAGTSMDPNREKFFDRYAEKRRGKAHPNDPRKFDKVKKAFKNNPLIDVVPD